MRMRSDGSWKQNLVALEAADLTPNLGRETPLLVLPPCDPLIDALESSELLLVRPEVELNLAVAERGEGFNPLWRNVPTRKLGCPDLLECPRVVSSWEFLACCFFSSFLNLLDAAADVGNAVRRGRCGRRWCECSGAPCSPLSHLPLLIQQWV